VNRFGAWIREQRDSRQMTREDLIAALKGYGKTVAPSTLTTWEQGGSNAPIHDNEFVEAIARIFGLPVVEVFRGAGYAVDAYPELDEARQLILAAFDSGDLGRLVRVAIEELDKKEAHRYERLESSSNDTETGAGTADAAATGRR
jgi:transcriptional regulator with XRE-family HTH domain